MKNSGTQSYETSLFTTQERYLAFLDGFNEKSLKKLNKDVGYTHFFTYFQPFRNETVPAYRTFQSSVNNLMQVYVEGKYAMYPNEKHWPDANSTLRITYGQLEGSAPTDGKNGYLMGLNFDRSWESTMSDYLFDPNRCRNIVVDIRYVLWVMDIYSDAKHLVDEMTLMKE